MIPDPCEILESLQEKVADVHQYDAATNTMLCCKCGKRFSIRNLEQLYNHPASPFVCYPCADAIYTRQASMAASDTKELP